MPDEKQPDAPNDLPPTGEVKVETLGRYRILGELGRGGCGVVYRALDPSIGRIVAVKTILPKTEPLSGQETRERFRREARSAGNLSHPNIVTVHDFSDTGDPMFIAMEFVEGQTLAEKMLQGPLELDFIRGILKAAADALDYAHSHQIVHRDIKPANFLISTGGRLKITDFGIAKIMNSDEGLTSTGMLIGTAQYMSPEQVSEAQVTGRSDQFSLAVIAYEMLTGIKPFQGNSWASVIHAIMAADPPAVTNYRDKLGPGVDAVLRRALSKDPSARYGSCINFISALELAITGSEIERTAILKRPPDAPTAPVVEQPTLVFPAPRKSEAEGSAQGKGLAGKPVLIGAIAGIFLAAGLWLALRPKPAAPAVPVVAQPAQPPASTPASPPNVEVASVPPVTKPSVRPEKQAIEKQTSEKQTKQIPQHQAAAPVETAKAAPPPQVATPPTQAPVPVQRETPPPAPVVAPPPAPVIPQVSAPVTSPVKPQEDPAKKAAEEQLKRAADEQAKRLADEQTKRAAADQVARLAEQQAQNARTAELAAISRALRDYQTAYQRKDLAALQAVWPSIPKQSLDGIRSTFRDASEIDMELHPVGDPKVAGQTATVICDRSLHQVILKRSLQASGRVRIVLNRTATGWIIQSVEQVNQ